MYKYKAKLFKSIFIFSIIFSVLTLTVSAFGNKPDSAGPSQPSPIMAGYTVKEYDGKIAVFKNGESAPLEIIDGIFVRDLPTYDRELLSEGIYAENEAALQKLLEDYDS